MYPDELILLLALLLIFIASQIFWIRRVVDLVGRVPAWAECAEGELPALSDIQGSLL